MDYENLEMDEEMQAYYEGKAEGESMFTEEQHKALDKLLKDAKDSIIKDLKKRSLIDFIKEGKEVENYKKRKKKLEQDLDTKKTKIRNLDYEIRNREYDISIKEKAIAKKEQELQANYEKAIEEYAFTVEKNVKDLLKDGLGKALKSFTLPKFYTIGYDYVQQEKCPLCDENRKRHFTDDQGKTYEIDCPCDTKHSVYKVFDAEIKFNFGFIPSKLEDSDTMEDLLAKSISIESRKVGKHSYSKFLKACFNPKIESPEEYKSRIKYSSEYFTSIEDAQLYCNYKQAIEDRKTKENYTDLKLKNLLVDDDD